MSGEATIRRGVRNARYAAIPNHVFEDARLSMEARWLLSYLLSKPDNWTVVIGDIVRKGNCGRDKARKMIAELVETGYAEREQTRADG
nr:helix-turn-helix domain-containing protein [Agrobacterium vitis]